ncbi:hypothetical protein [Butyrivibrio fibrisolvens]|uniref:Uncharacterized protein n=1 Tax=Butyrivibrio fibrisolvens TaxID=831 RepID=A0A317G8G8_BUTFI|nr:hypothetical protein [Butyrivibrio fibrisolvens]PWT29123.1 hypothetical protein CPT75_19430 [Butyrivibrio fibrisolvens]
MILRYSEKRKRDHDPVQNSSEQNITTVDINNYDSWLKAATVGDYYSFSGTAIYVSEDYYGKGYICVRLFNTKTNNKECRIIIYTTKDISSKISVDDMIKSSGKCTGRDDTNLPIITTNDISIIK